MGRVRWQRDEGGWLGWRPRRVLRHGDSGARYATGAPPGPGEEAFLVVDDVGDVVHATVGAEAIFDTAPGGLVGRRVEALVTKPFRTVLAERRSHAASDLDIVERMRAVRADGRAFDADVAVRRLRSGDRSVTTVAFQIPERDFGA